MSKQPPYSVTKPIAVLYVARRIGGQWETAHVQIPREFNGAALPELIAGADSVTIKAGCALVKVQSAGVDTLAIVSSVLNAIAFAGAAC